MGIRVVIYSLPFEVERFFRFCLFRRTQVGGEASKKRGLTFGKTHFIGPRGIVRGRRMPLPNQRT